MKNEVLWSLYPAGQYRDAFPVGNGRLGAMPCGGVCHEKINLNEDTLWSGYPRAVGVDNAYERFTKRIRQKIIKEDDYYGAEDLADHLQGPYNESYLCAGELSLDFGHGAEAEDYQRGLDMKTGIAFTEYSCDGVGYRREVFASEPDDVIVIHLSANRAGSLSMTGTLNSMIRHETAGDEDFLVMNGRAPRHVEPQYLESGIGQPEAIIYDEEWEDRKGLRFSCCLKISHTGGTMSVNAEGFSLKNANDAVLWLWLGTDFNRNRFSAENTAYNLPDYDPETAGRNALDRIVQTGYEAVLQRHIADMEEHFNRVALNFVYDRTLDELPTKERKERYRRGEPDAGLEKQFFDFGRYLLYSCSREGTQAANLQGIWCWQMRPPWSGNYTVNINTQMNYWGVEMLNLSECHLPLIDMIDDLTHTGAVTASMLYGARGFCVHHNADLWRSTCPIGMGQSDCKWSLFPTAGIWLSLHIWEHYLFTRDQRFLEKYFHILKQACLFAVDMMCELGNGTVGICPATVPERRFTKPDGTVFAVGAGSTFDYELLNELFSATRAAIDTLRLNENELLTEIDGVQSKFPPIPISENGVILDWQFETEPEPYLWINTLFGLYPGHCLFTDEASLRRAVLATLERYDQPSGTFSNTWSAGAWARLGMADTAYRRMRHHIADATLDNLLGVNRNSRPIAFQVDSNFGGIAAITEMLIQSTEDEIVLLPALPAEWSSGSIDGVRTRNGCTVGLSWENDVVTGLEIISQENQAITVRQGISGTRETVCLNANERKTVI